LNGPFQLVQQSGQIKNAEMGEIGTWMKERSYVCKIFIGGPHGKRLLGVDGGTIILKYINSLTV
jgi:hypothetical protein